MLFLNTLTSLAFLGASMVLALPSGDRHVVDNSDFNATQAEIARALESRSTDSTTVHEFFQYRHEGVDSLGPDWAWNDALNQISSKWVTFLKAYPNTAAVIVMGVPYGPFGGTVGRVGSIDPAAITVTNPGSKTKGATLFHAKSWKCWMDLEYDITLLAVPDPSVQPSLGASREDMISVIALQVGDSMSH